MSSRARSSWADSTRARPARATLAGAALAACALAGCGASLAPAGVTVVLEGSAPRAEVRRALETPIDPAVALRPVELEDAPAARATDPADDTLALRIASARRAYVETLELDACVDTLGDPALVHQALARGARERAARALTFLAACLHARGDETAAVAVARRLAVHGLDVPAAAGAVSPRVESLLAEAVASVASAPRIALDVRSEPEGAEVSLDGRAVACRTPCRIELVAGEHVVALAAEGRESTWERVQVDAHAARELAFELAPASPGLAAAQWRERHRAAPDAWPSLRLLQVAARDRRVVLLWTERDEALVRLRAALAIDDAPPRRVERAAPADALEEATRAALRDLLAAAGVIPPRPIEEEPLFWIALIGAAAVAGGITGAILYEPPVENPVSVIGRAP